MTKPVTAIQKIERSKLDPKTIQREMMGDDLDLEKLVVYLKSKIKFDAAERVLDLGVERTVEGADTITLSLNDYERQILNSGLLNNRLDIQIDGLWFRLVKVGRARGSSQLDLTFETREIAILRTYPKKGTPHNGVKFAHRSNTTRFEFMLNLIREVKEMHIPVVIPELHKVQPVEKSTDAPSVNSPNVQTGDKGISPDINTTAARERQDRTNPRPTIPQATVLTVKGEAASQEQIRNANIILDTGHSMGARRRVLVSAIMTAIVESTIHNLPGGDADSVGLFQQRASWGSYQDRHDPATSARLYFNQAIPEDNKNPTEPLWLLCANVQRPREDLREVYADYRVEAERFVTSYGIPGNDNEGSAAEANNSSQGQFATDPGDYVFYRGTPKAGGKVWERENNWDCLQRLATEVNVRCFFISGVCYIISDDDLFKTQPVMIVDESSQGIDAIGFDYDVGKKVATVDMSVRVGTWLAPPGAVAVVQHMGPVSGRWLITDFSRSLFNPTADLTLKKPMPELPEPIDNTVTTFPDWASPTDKQGAFKGSVNNWGAELPTQVAGNKMYGKFMAPLSTDPHLERSEFAMIDAEGAPDQNSVRHHAAKDWFAPGGTPVVAPIAGIVVEVKQSRGNSGQVFGGVVKLEMEGGYVWVFRHVQPTIGLYEGQSVTQGFELATVVNWADSPSTSHCHIEVWKTLSGGYYLPNMLDPVLFLQGKAS